LILLARFIQGPGDCFGAFFFLDAADGTRTFA
jgi:hypothetical protein